MRSWSRSSWAWTPAARSRRRSGALRRRRCPRDEAWIYSAYRVRNYTYQAPQVVERDVVAISFDADGVVSNVERFGLEDGQLVQLSRRTTESSVRDLGFFRQLMRNLGRVDLGALGN
jgi:hypothetical protein